MKASKLALGVLAALSVNNVAMAEQTERFEFHGYFRTGVLASVENDFKRSNYIGQKETLGRLGLEADNDYKARLVSAWDFDDGRNFKIHFGLSKQGKESALASGDDALDVGISDAYVEFNGVSESGTFWAGRREYGKSDNYIFMTDFFYTDMSGTGIGLEGYEWGDSIVDVAYIASDRVNDDIDRWAKGPAEQGNNAKNLNNLMHALHISSTFGDVKLSALVKAMPDNWDTYGSEWAEFGYDLTLTYSMSSFFGAPGNGFSKFIVQGGQGLGAGNLLGGTITGYNAYHPGSLAQGQQDAWDWHPEKGDAYALITQVDDDDTSARVLLWGGYTFENGISLFPSIQAQYNDMAINEDSSWRLKSDYNYWVSAMVRPTFPVSSHFYVQAEVGAVYNNWGGSSWTQSKISVAPTFILPTSLGVAPEIRLLASYLPKSWTNNVEQADGSFEAEDDFIIGFQADVWW